VFISHAGEVLPCCYAGHDLHFGNILEEPLEGIVERMYASPFFTQSIKGRCPTCRLGCADQKLPEVKLTP
jgi:MoaA/NifB/PqqE/SkfB family radical SAM enzyme